MGICFRLWQKNHLANTLTKWLLSFIPDVGGDRVSSHGWEGNRCSNLMQLVISTKGTREVQEMWALV